MEYISVTLDICTLHNGLPHGFAVITFKHPKSIAASFVGVGSFNNGKLDNTPFTCVTGNGWGYSFFNM